MIKKLVSHLGEYKRAAILTPILSALEAIMDVLLPTIMAFIIDQGIEKGDMNAVVKYGLLTFLVAAIALLLGVLAGRFAATASTGFAGNLRDAMYENIQHFSFSNIDKYSTAGLVTRMTTDVTNLQNAFQMIERMCVRAPVHLVFALIMASMISRSLTMVFLVAIVFLVAVLAGIMVPTFGIFDKVFKNYDNLNASVQENVSAIRVVKSFVREHFENEKYTKACESLYKQFVHAGTRLSQSGDVNSKENSVAALFGNNGQNAQMSIESMSKKISLKMMTLNNSRQKINDCLGNPVEIGIAVIWRVTDTAKAVFNVDNYKEYLSLQCDSALRNVVRVYPYDVAPNVDTTGDGVADEGSLRGSSEVVAARIRDEIQKNVSEAGIEVVEARITYLAYAPEIAAVMLQRQQASAIIDARKMIVDGAVGMVEMALDRLSENKVVELDDERKAAMVSNLLVVLCGNRDAQPIVNSGSLY